MERDISLDPNTKRFIQNQKEERMVSNNQVEAVEAEEPLGLEGPEPGSEADKIDKLLDQNYSAKQLRGMGFASSTIRKRLKKRTKEKGMPAPENSGKGGNHEVTLTVKEKEQVLPEWLEQQIGELYDGNEQTKKVFMAGMSIPLLGMRLFAESFKPLLALMQANTASQAEVAKSLQGGSEEVAQQTIVQAMPYFKDMITEVSRNQAVNPIQSMMVRAIEPIFQNVISGVMGGMFGMKQPQGKQGQSQSLPPGWEQK